MRQAWVPLALCGILLAGWPPEASPRNPVAESAFDRLERSLLKRAESSQNASERADAYLRLNQIRNQSAMRELLAGLPAGRPPTRFLYAASGDHMAPLVACAADSGTRPYAFIYTEVAPSYREGIDGFLRLLVREGMVTNLSSGPPAEGKPGYFAWNFRLGRHPVALTLVINPDEARAGDNRLYPAWALAQSDMVITHDWAGDQQENLRLVWELLQSVRAAGSPRGPLLMIEDLERHPFPVDLSLFEPIARTNRPYGHRKPLNLGLHTPTPIELGQALYGGAVILSFGQPWWRMADERSLRSTFDFLLFNEFDSTRLNVLEGGDNPLLAPPLVDRFAGYGYRAILGEDVREASAIMPAMMRAAAGIQGRLPPRLRDRMARRMLLYRCLLELEAAGEDVSPLTPASRYRRRPGQNGEPWPSADMENLAREATEEEAANPGLLLRARTEDGARAKALLEIARAEPYLQASLAGLGKAGSALPTASAGWSRLYVDQSARLNASGQLPRGDAGLRGGAGHGELALPGGGT